MATQKYTVQFRIIDEITLPEEVDRHSAEILRQIIAYAEINDIVPDSFEMHNAGKAFNPHSDDTTITKTETIVTIIFDTEADVEGLNGTDAATQLYVQALRAIKDNPNAKITGHNYREQLPRSLTVIEITA